MRLFRKLISLPILVSFLAIQNCDLVCAFLAGPHLRASHSIVAHDHCGAGKMDCEKSAHHEKSGREKKSDDSCSCINAKNNPSINSPQWLNKPTLRRTFTVPLHALLIQNSFSSYPSALLAGHSPPGFVRREVYTTPRSPRAPPFFTSL